MEKFGADIKLSAREALMVRAQGGKVGLHLHKQNYLTVVPKLTFTDGKPDSIALLPVALNFERKDDCNGLPVVAGAEDRGEILAKLREMSAPFGTEIREENGVLIPGRAQRGGADPFFRRF